KMSQTICNSTREKAADAVAAALAEGVAPDSISEAISLAATQLVLRDPGRPKEWASGNKPAGSCHGDSVGVHASDAANAWRNIARVSTQSNAVASLILGAYHTAGQYGRLGKEPYPLPEHLEKVTAKDPAMLLKGVEAAIRDKDQFRTLALVHRYG